MRALIHLPRQRVACLIYNGQTLRLRPGIDSHKAAGTTKAKIHEDTADSKALRVMLLRPGEAKHKTM